MEKLKVNRWGMLINPFDLLHYEVRQVEDKPYYGRIVYGQFIEVNVEKRIPYWRRTIALIHEGLHAINPGWTHIQLHNLAVGIFVIPDADAVELSLVTKAVISEGQLHAIQCFIWKNRRKIQTKVERDKRFRGLRSGQIESRR